MHQYLFHFCAKAKIAGVIYLIYTKTTLKIESNSILINIIILYGQKFYKPEKDQN